MERQRDGETERRRDMETRRKGEEKEPKMNRMSREEERMKKTKGGFC